MSKSPPSEFKSSVGAVMIRVPAGTFTMGSPESEDGHRVWERHREVTFASDFYLGLRTDLLHVPAADGPAVLAVAGQADLQALPRRTGDAHVAR
jgi:hypothetical protein